MTHRLAKAAGGMSNDWARAIPMKFNSDFSKSLPTRLFFQKTRGTTGWATARKGGGRRHSERRGQQPDRDPDTPVRREKQTVLRAACQNSASELEDRVLFRRDRE